MNKTKGLGILYHIISTSFAVIVVISNIISAKMVKLPYFESLTIPAGLITYPLTFLLSDVVTEIFGAKKAKLMVYLALGMNLLTLAILQISLMAPAFSSEEERAFQAILGLSGLRIFASLVAYTISQIADIQIYALIKKWTGFQFLWMRSNGSTWISQFIDTVIIDIIFLFFGLGMAAAEVFPIMLFSFTYKALFSVAITPLFYLCIILIRKRMKTINVIT